VFSRFFLYRSVSPILHYNFSVSSLRRFISSLHIFCFKISWITYKSHFEYSKRPEVCLWSNIWFPTRNGITGNWQKHKSSS